MDDTEALRQEEEHEGPQEAVASVAAKIDIEAPADQRADAMKQINDRLQTVLDQAPSDSAAELVVRKTSDGFKGLLKIYSSQRRFTGGFRSKGFSEVIDRIFREVQDQIHDWKRGRFDEASLGTP